MRMHPLSWKLILPVALLALTAGILSCAPVETGPRVWIDFPLEGSQFFPDTTVSVTCHAFAPEGVADVQLAVNGEPYRLAGPSQPGEQFVEISMEWLATEPGDYALSVTAFDMTGAATNRDTVTVSVVGDAPQLIIIPGAPTDTPTSTGVPTDTPTSTGEPTDTPTSTGEPTDTPTSTGIPTDTPTSTPTSTATTPPRPTIVSFGANPTSIEAGECTTLSWAVEGQIQAVYLDGEGVGAPDSRQRCPDATTTYTLRAVGPGGEDTATASVSVTEPPAPDTEGPPAPGGMSPTGGEEQGCGAVTLSWNSVSDPSGIDMYYVKVEKVTGTFKSGAWTTTDTELTVPATWLVCGYEYRWAVRAEDGAGNIGPWSAWADFTVTIV